MPSPFVWFDNIGAKREETTDFLNKTFNWSANNIGPMTFLTNDGELPFAATCDTMDEISGWVPYVVVDELEPAVANAKSNGATIVAEPNFMGSRMPDLPLIPRMDKTLHPC